jgi:lysophospholipase L1-like esterase
MVWVATSLMLGLAMGCENETIGPSPSGGASTGGVATGVGGVSGAGVATGGYSMGGVSTGGRSSGGASTGGAAIGGRPSGGASTGGRSSGGASTGGAASGGSSMGGSAHVGPWRIVPLGDSITGTTCYPQLLSRLLIQAGRSNFIFVGSQLNNQVCDGAPNVQSEGHGGYWVTQLLPGGAHASEAATWAAANQAEIVLMHFATNDLWKGTIPTQRILEAFSLVIASYRAVDPNVVCLVAQIIPNAGCSTCGTSIPAFNTALVDWAAAENTTASPIYLVDQYTGFDPATDTNDGCHPNVTGSQKMAVRWADALQARGLL